MENYYSCKSVAVLLDGMKCINPGDWELSDKTRWRWMLVVVLWVRPSMRKTVVDWLELHPVVPSHSRSDQNHISMFPCTCYISHAGHCNCPANFYCTPYISCNRSIDWCRVAMYNTYIYINQSTVNYPNICHALSLPLYNLNNYIICTYITCWSWRWYYILCFCIIIWFSSVKYNKESRYHVTVWRSHK